MGREQDTLNLILPEVTKSLSLHNAVYLTPPPSHTIITPPATPLLHIHISALVSIIATDILKPIEKNTSSLRKNGLYKHLSSRQK